MYNTSFTIMIYISILVFIIIIVISGLYYNYNKSKNIEHFISSRLNYIKVLAITYDTDVNNPHINNLINMFTKYNYNYTVLGNGDTWNGWYGRALAYKEYINTLDDNTYILLCDGRDVVINQDSSTFIKKILECRISNGNRIIVGTETGCCTIPMPDIIYKAKNITENINFILEYIRQQKSGNKYNNAFNYINFGLMCGKAVEFKNLFNILNIQPGEDDQAILHKLYYEDPKLLILDYNQEILSNASHDKNSLIKYDNTEFCYYKWDSIKLAFKNTITNTYPSVIQTPAKNWDCYKLLANKLLPNPQFVEN